MSTSRKRSAESDTNDDTANVAKVAESASPRKKLAKLDEEIAATEETGATEAVKPDASAEPPAQPMGFLAYAKVNPFANAMSAPILGANSPKSPKPNPFSSPSPAHNPFISFTDEKSSIWGTLSSSNVVGSTADATSVQRVTDDKTNGDNNSSETKHETSPVKAEAPVDVDNGEKGEECLFQLRVKLFRLSSSDKSIDNANDAKESETKAEWVEVGIGPLRILESTEKDVSSKYRLVMRRENQPGGQGTKLLLNVLLKGHVNIVKVSDKASRLTFITTLESDASVSTVASYLVKTKQVKETDDLVELVTRVVRDSE